MINLKREPLRGEVEVDETWVGGTQAGLRGSRQLKGRKASLVLVAVEKRGSNTTGRARMAVIPDFRSEILLAFLKDNVAPGSTVYTDGLKSFTGLKEAGFRHVSRAQPLRTNLRKGAKSVVPLAAFQTLRGLGTGRKPAKYKEIRGASDLGEPPAEG
jgi:transposase-like protein